MLLPMVKVAMTQSVAALSIDGDATINFPVVGSLESPLTSIRKLSLAFYFHHSEFQT